MKKNKKIIIFLLLHLFLFNINPKDKNVSEPSWVYLKKAENLKEKGEYSLAIIEARKSREIFINEKLELYYEEIRDLHRDKIEYELITMKKEKEQELLQNDNYPQYHELMGDLYVLTNLMEEAENEYKTALAQKKYLEFPQKALEIKYKIAEIHNKKSEFELADIVYREILKDYFELKHKEYWDRIRENINKDKTLEYVFKIYRIEGMEYLKALYMIGRRAAILQRKKEAMFYLVNAAIVWMTHYSNLIKKYHFDFQYSNPTDFINYIAKRKIYEYESEELLMDEILFFIGYIYYLDKDAKLYDYFFNLAKIFSKNTNKEIEIKNRIDYLLKVKDHIITYEELMNY